MKHVVTIATDPIADMLSRIRNGVAVGKAQISLPYSKVKETVAKILAENGFIKEVSVDSDSFGRKQIRLVINEANQPARLTEIVRLSSPGRRSYVKSGKIPSIKRGRGIVVISTSQGMMTGEQAKAKHLGGELICKVY